MTSYHCKNCDYEAGDEEECPICGLDWTQPNSLIIKEKVEV